MREAQERIDSAEFAEWLAYYNLDPWGDDWQQAAMIGSLITYGPLKKPIKQADLIPGKRRRKRQTPEEMMGVFKAVAAAQNERAKKGKP